MAKLLLNISLKFLYGIALFIFGCIKSSLLHASFSSCGERVSSLVVVLGFLTAVAFLAVEHGLWSCGPSVAVACGLSRRGSWALEHRLVVVAHRLSCSAACKIFQGFEPMSSASAGGFLTTGPRRKSYRIPFNRYYLIISSPNPQVKDKLSRRELFSPKMKSELA